jgi:hypothetical protein
MEIFIIVIITAIMCSSGSSVFWILRMNQASNSRMKEIREHTKDAFNDGWSMGCIYGAKASDDMKEIILENK